MTGRETRSLVRAGGIALVAILLAIAGCRQAEPPAEPTGTPETAEARWSIERLSADYPLTKIEVAGSYEQIGYALGQWYRELGYGTRPLTGDEQEQSREMIAFYRGVRPGIVEQLRGMYAAYGLRLDDVQEAIPVSDSDGVRFLLPGVVEGGSCSVVATRPEMSDDGHARLGRNYDWPGEVPDTYLVFTEPEGGYATAIMTAHTPGLSAADGLNSEGLALGFASVRDTGYELPAGPALISGFAYRLILETCANVEEALTLLRSVPITFAKASPEDPITHLLLADRSGASAVVEFLPEGTVVSRADQPYQVMTNSHWAGPADQADCPRYRRAVAALEQARGRMDTEALMDVMSSVQSSTMWTTVYDLQDLSLTLTLPGVDPSIRYRFSLAGAALAPPTLSPTRVPAPPASAPLPPTTHWPADGWPTSTPEEQGMDSELLAEAIDWLLGQDTHSLLVIRNGTAVVDATFYPFTPDTKHDVASVTKSWTATLVGVALQQGYLSSVEQPVLDFFPGRTVAHLDADKQAITIKDLLTMKAGLECTLEPTEATLIEMMASPEWVQFALDLPMAEAPGTRWNYCSPAAHLLAAILEQATGRSALDFAHEELFNPLGIPDVAWPTDPQGIIRGYGDLRLTPHDMAKLGYLYLNDGWWEGVQLLPTGWVEAATSAAQGTPDDGYGYLWWLSDGVYSARGRGGQWIVVAPDKGMVVVLTNAGRVEELLASYLFPAVRSAAPLPPNPDGVARLESTIRRAARAPRTAAWPAPVLPPVAKEVSGKTYALGANPFGFSTASWTLQEPTVAVLRITAAAGSAAGAEELEWLVGLDNVERFAPGRFGIPAAAKGAWASNNTFVAQVNEIGNNFRWEVSLTFEEDIVTVEMRDLTGFFPTSLQFDGKLQKGQP